MLLRIPKIKAEEARRRVMGDPECIIPQTETVAELTQLFWDSFVDRFARREDPSAFRSTFMYNEV